MEAKRSLSGREKFAYGIGAVGKDMVYMLSASYISIYFLDVMGISAAAIAVLLMAAQPACLMHLTIRSWVCWSQRQKRDGENFVRGCLSVRSQMQLYFT